MAVVVALGRGGASSGHRCGRCSIGVPCLLVLPGMSRRNDIGKPEEVIGGSWGTVGATGPYALTGSRVGEQLLRRTTGSATRFVNVQPIR